MTRRTLPAHPARPVYEHSLEGVEQWKEPTVDAEPDEALLVL
ncbi:hypothetical protein [Nocardia speluncae]|nr:hypothetical protein [Nocardia speluncae]